MVPGIEYVLLKPVSSSGKLRCFKMPRQIILQLHVAFRSLHSLPMLLPIVIPEREDGVEAQSSSLRRNRSIRFPDFVSL